MEITFDKRNYRKHNAKNKKIIRKSLEELGAGRSVVVDNENCLVAGNGVYEQAQALKMPVRVVETDGSELVVVKRTDLATGDERRRKLALADNSASDTSEWNEELLCEDWSKELLEDWGVNMPETAYLSKMEIETMYYRPLRKPDIKLQDCVDLTKYEAKLRVIEELQLPEETKAVLSLFAYRFIKIDFESVANYYAFNASDEEKKAIERLRMVLVDNGEEGLGGFIEDDMLRINDLMIGEQGENEDE